MSDAMDAGTFRERVNQRGRGIEIGALVLAADHYVATKGPPFADAHIEAAIDLARRIVARRHQQTEPRDAPVALPPTPYSRLTAGEWLDLAKPVVARIRLRAFGSADAPFDQSNARTTEWIESQLAALSSTPPDTSEAVQAEKSKARKAVATLVRVSRRSWSLAPNRFELAYYGRTGTVETRELQGISVPGPDEIETTHPIAALAAFSNDLSAAAGFRRPDVTSYVLNGVTPELPRVQVRASRVFSRWILIGEGDAPEQFTGARVHVDFLTPDMTWKDLRTLQRELRHAWALVDVQTPDGSRPQRPRLTPTDHQLLRVFDRLGGVPDNPGAEWWQRVDQTWNDAGYGPRAIDSHRTHWLRLSPKLERPGVRPEVGQKREKPEEG